MTCKTCKFWQAGDINPLNLTAPRIGICLRYPPVPYPVSADATMNILPQTTEGSWCGEYQKRDPTYAEMVTGHHLDS